LNNDERCFASTSCICLAVILLIFDACHEKNCGAEDLCAGVKTVVAALVSICGLSFFATLIFNGNAQRGEGDNLAVEELGGDHIIVNNNPGGPEVV